jgi:transcriptional regulator with XRE-family HTH domain
VSRNTVVNYETGHTPPKLIVMRAWAVECQVPIEWLLGEPMVPQDAADQDGRTGPWQTGSMRDRASTAA